VSRRSLTKSRYVQLACAWSGPFFFVLFLVGLVPLAHFFPAPSPAFSAGKIASIYRHNTTGIRIGMLLEMISCGFLGPWGALIAARLRRHEPGVPVLAYTQVAMVGVAVIVLMLIPFFWGVAAFRPYDLSPNSIRMLNDVGWYAFLFTFAPFMVWTLVIALSILLDGADKPVFPRWVGWFNVWVPLTYTPAGLILFFKHGPFAYDGALALWLPTIVYFSWMVIMTWCLIKSINEDVPATMFEQAGVGDTLLPVPLAPEPAERAGLGR
jgi:hypothetical protein